MLRFCVAVLLFLGVTNGRVIPGNTDESSSSKSHGFQDIVMDLIKNKCDGNTAKDEEQNAWLAANQCMHISSSDLNICDKYDRECLKPVVDAIGTCLGEEEQYLKQFIEDVLDFQVQFRCDKNKQALIDLYSHPDTIECQRKLKDDPEKNACTDTLLQSLSVTAAENVLLTKTKVCSSLSTYENCKRTLISRICPSNTGFLQHVEDGFKMYHNTCRNVIST